MIEISVTEKDFFLPEDGDIAKEEFLKLLKNPGETWIGAFGFTFQPMFDEIKEADAGGVQIHLLLDHSQSGGSAEAPKVKDLAGSLKHGDLTITTAGVNSASPSQIWHWKGLAVKDTHGEGYTCWEGSTNFSESGWKQGNSARLFRSDEWARAFISQFEAHRTWAQENEPQYQLGSGKQARNTKKPSSRSRKK